MNLKVGPLLTLFGTFSGTVGLPVVAHDFTVAHPYLYLTLVAISLIAHSVLPSIFGAPSDADKKATGLGTVPVLLFVLCLGLIFATPIKAQTADASSFSNLYGAGVSYSVNASPSIAGTGLYARQLTDSGTYAFTVADMVPNTVKPFTVNTNFGVGVAQKVLTIGKVPIFMPTAAGISFNGQNTGFQWNGGALAAFHIKGNYYAMPSVRFLKSSVSYGTGYQPIIGVLIGGFF